MCMIRDCGATVGNCSTDGRSKHDFGGDKKSWEWSTFGRATPSDIWATGKNISPTYRRDANLLINMFFVAVCSIIFITGDILFGHFTAFRVVYSVLINSCYYWWSTAYQENNKYLPFLYNSSDIIPSTLPDKHRPLCLHLSRITYS